MTNVEAPASDRLAAEPPASRLCTAGIEAETERLLAGRTRDIRLSNAMMERYQGWSWPRRAKVVRAWMLWVAALNILLSVVGSFLVPVLFVPSLLLMGFSIPLANLGVYRLWRRPWGPWIEPLSLISVTIATMIGYGVLSAMFGGAEHERYLTGALFLATIGVIVFDMALGWTIVLGTSALLVFGFFQVFNSSVGLSQALFSIAFFGAGVIGTIEARRTTTIFAHKSFLLTVRNAMQQRALAEANENLHRLATQDPLTGIANRRSIKTHTDQLWRDPAVDKGRIAVIMADIDHFKRLNDTFGHAVGDACIRQVADVMVASTRKDLDLVSRYGGEEFMVVLTEASAETVLSIAERIRSAVEATAIVDPSASAGVLSVTISLGVAIAREGIGAELLVNLADDALYEAKRLGRNQVCVGSVDLQPRHVAPRSPAPGGASAGPKPSSLAHFSRA